MMTTPEETGKVAKQRAPKEVSHSHLLIGITALLVIVVGISCAFSVVLWRQIKEMKEAHNTSLASLQQTISQLQGNQQTEDQNQSRLLRIVQSPDKLSQQQAFSEISYLIRMASLHLRYGNDVKGGEALLQQANARVEKLKSNQFTQLKAALQNDLSALSKVSNVDQAAILQKLNQVGLAVMKLPLASHELKTEQPAANPAKTDAPQSWWQRLKNNLGGLKQLVVVQRIPASADVLVGPTQVVVIKQEIQVKLAQAQWAVLRYRGDIYQQSVKSALQLVSELESLRLPGVHAIAAELTALESVDIAAQPVKLESLTLINNE